MEYSVTPKLVNPTNIPQDLYGLQGYADSSLFIDSTLILCSAVCYATLTPLMVRLSILPRIKPVSARNIYTKEVCCLKSQQSRVPVHYGLSLTYLLSFQSNNLKLKICQSISTIIVFKNTWSGAVTPGWYSFPLKIVHSFCHLVLTLIRP